MLGKYLNLFFIEKEIFKLFFFIAERETGNKCEVKTRCIRNEKSCFEKSGEFTSPIVDVSVEFIFYSTMNISSRHSPTTTAAT